jgi:enoyl-CoA hydratase/carnithine racemase
MTERVTITVTDHIADVRFNRPDKLNALDRDQIAAIAAAGERLAAMKDVRVIVLSGEGAGFCAGLDMSSFTNPATTNRLTDRTHGDANLYQHIVMLWRRLPAPVIAAVHGACIGGGLQFASAADIRVVAPDAKLAIMEMRWGLIPDMGSFATWRSFVRDDVLRELTYTNRIFSGEEGKELGFVSHLSDTPFETAMTLAREIASRNPTAIKAAKRVINQLPDLTESEILMLESVEQEKVGTNPNQKEAVFAFIEKRAANFVD